MDCRESFKRIETNLLSFSTMTQLDVLCKNYDTVAWTNKF